MEKGANCRSRRAADWENTPAVNPRILSNVHPSATNGIKKQRNFHSVEASLQINVYRISNRRKDRAGSLKVPQAMSISP